jgi:hypothetical protein
LCVVIPQQPNDVYLKETSREGLRKKLKLTIIGMPKAIIVEIVNSARKIKEEMPTPCRSRRSQPLLDSEDLDEKSVDDEQKKEKSQGAK